MYIPNPQQVLAAGLAACGGLRGLVDRELFPFLFFPLPIFYSPMGGLRW